MSAPVKVPADIDRPDKVMAGLTARQVVLLGATATLVWAGWLATRTLLPLGIYLVVALPVAAGGILLALVRRDGVGLDEWVRAALAYRLRPHHHHNPDTHPHSGGQFGEQVPGWVAARAHHTTRPPRSTPLPRAAMPATAITTPRHGPEDVGLIDLGAHGTALVAAASTVNFALRSPTEQHTLIECFARMLHAQTGPLQILVRSHPVDLTPTLTELAHATTTLPHPALRAAAAGHHQWLAELSRAGGLLARQVLIVLREPTTPNPRLGHTASSGAGAGVQARLVRRLAEVSRCLAPADITVTPLSPAQLGVVLATSTDPTRRLPALPHPRLPHPGGYLSTHAAHPIGRDREDWG